jgi:hypothetical protein
MNQTGFDLHLDCNFHDKQAQFYLKEYPGQLDTEFDSRKNPPPTTPDAIMEYRLAALRAVLVGLNREIAIQRGGHGLFASRPLAAITAIVPFLRTIS